MKLPTVRNHSNTLESGVQRRSHRAGVLVILNGPGQFLGCIGNSRYLTTRSMSENRLLLTTDFHVAPSRCLICELTIRLVAAALLMSWSVLATGQISSHFYWEKSTFPPGEPIFLYFEVVNDGQEAENLHSADPYSFSSGNKSRYRATQIQPPHALRVLHIERLLLNFDHEINAPGPYSVTAERHLSHAVASADFFSPDSPKETLEVHVSSTFASKVPSSLSFPSILKVSLLESWGSSGVATS